MNRTLRNLAWAAIAASVAFGAPAQAEINDENCAPIFNQIFSGNGFEHGRPHWFSVNGTRISARDGAGRNGAGFSSFTMSTAYQAEDGMSNNTAKGKSTFRIDRERSNAAYRGQFHDVFTDRADGKEDTSTLALHRDGRVELTLDSWGGERFNLQGLSCFSGYGRDQFIITGYRRGGGAKLSVFSFLLMPEWLL